MEIWRDIRGYEGLYQVSNLGRVRSLDRIVIRDNGRPFPIKEKIIKPQTYDFKHLCVTVYKNGTQKMLPIHKAVANAFIPNPNGCDVVHHRNHNPKDNRVENLKWMTKSQHQILHNTERETRIVYQYTIDNVLVAVWKNASEAAIKLGYNLSAIFKCCNGGFYYKDKWVNVTQHKGYKWSYEPL